MDWGCQEGERRRLEGAAVISEHQFSTHYSSVWRSVTPLSDGFWAIENKQAERVDPPLRSSAPKEMRAIVNEIAFLVFCELRPSKRRISESMIRTAAEAKFQEAIDYIARFSNAQPFKLSDINDGCRIEVNDLVNRLLGYFPRTATTILRPKFPGCGLLSACEGDLIQGDCLYEVKAGDRAFRILDLRQLLTYSALAYASDSLTFSRIGLFNPRTGVAWSKSLDEVCQSIAGLKPNDTLSTLADHFSVASESR